MVQIVRRRKSLGMDDRGLPDSPTRRRRNDRLTASPSNSFKTCIQFLLLSSVIPGLFFLRMTLHNGDDDEEATSFLRSPLSIPKTLPEPFAFLPPLLQAYCARLRIEERPNSQTSSTMSAIDYELLLHSDIVELHHCRLAFTTAGNTMDWKNFTTWATPIIHNSSTIINQQQLQTVQEAVQQQELILELLELYLTHHGHCNFKHYHPGVPQQILEATTTTHALEQTELEDPPSSYHARLAFVITVDTNTIKDDIQHVRHLVQAIHMPHHYIILHIPTTTTTPALVKALQEMEQDYDNVVVVQFGTLIHGMGSSMIHLKLMRWLIRDMALQYDYHITLDASSFPLYSADELAQHLQSSSTNSVWLGSLTEQGSKPVSLRDLPCKEQQQLTITTTTGTVIDIGHALSSSSNGLTWGKEFMEKTDKTTSGRFAVFSYDLVVQLIDSPRVMELFARSKYARCPSSSLDNYIWMAALKLIAMENVDNKHVLEQARQKTSMFQLWGCNEDTEASVLALDASRCYRIEYPQVVQSVYDERGNNNNNNNARTIPRERLHIHGNETMVYVKHAKERFGFLFARSFDSSNPQSVALRESIEATWVEKDFP